VKRPSRRPQTGSNNADEAGRRGPDSLSLEKREEGRFPLSPKELDSPLATRRHERKIKDSTVRREKMMPIFRAKGCGGSKDKTPSQRMGAPA